MNPFPEPPSWLSLEQHALDELSAEERAAVDGALASDPATRACRDLIDRPVELRPLVRRAAARPRLSAVWWIAPLAAAAAVLLLITLRRGDGDGPRPERVKGGDAAITLLREREGSVEDRPTQFAPGDRFKVLLTCAPGAEGVWEVAVFQGGRAFFPLDPAEVTGCGNALPLTGAFGIDGAEPARVCAVRSVPGRGRSDLERAGEDALDDRTPCVVLESAP